jgi:hypothetical protein
MSSVLSSDSEFLWVARDQVIKVQEYVLVQKADIAELVLEGACTREAKLRLAMLEEIARIFQDEYRLIGQRIKTKNRTTTGPHKTSAIRNSSPSIALTEI